MTILHTTQLHLYFTSFLARTPHHHSATCLCHSLLPLSHAIIVQIDELVNYFLLFDQLINM
jgi:hypothetical protein